MNFKDIEDSIRPFSGEESYQVENWVQDYEEMAEVMQFSELQKLVYAKKCLIGLAKQCIQCERGLNSWSKLKEILQDEFGKKISSADIHRLLSEKKKQSNESVLEYYFNMKEIAARSQIEEDAVIQYIVDGIPDKMCNKTFLYEARNFRQLKTKLETYEKIKSRPSSSSMDKQRINKNAVINASVTNKSKSATNVTANNIVRCYNCVRKKDGNYRMAVDYRELNKLTTRDIYPIPHIEEQIDNLKDRDRYVVKDPEGFQLTQLPYEGIASPANMKLWRLNNVDDNRLC
nr:PREDICTED: uncharacterized protein LOC107398359 [Tribolium castaneum]|eukprot:XP_015837697.1 PREDICTED: uncharacterized protein LOC107398359 [Tribolium castaneum]